MTPAQAALKRGFDFLAALFGLVALSWLILICWVLASIDTRSNGFFRQQRVGRHGRLFRIVKIKTMRTSSRTGGGGHSAANPSGTSAGTITVRGDDRVTRLGAFLRRFKLDEIPQLWNVLIGKMSMVGPRPDVQGYADQLQGEHRRLLELRPGITGPASLHFRNEEEMLAAADDPNAYNDEIIWPEKVRINLHYLDHYRFGTDLRLIWTTVFSS
jgi:lipopolysaccharide/colanic/teichoic acid biosynthesis glycosyltransferase